MQVLIRSVRCIYLYLQYSTRKCPSERLCTRTTNNTVESISQTRIPVEATITSFVMTDMTPQELEELVLLAAHVSATSINSIYTTSEPTSRQWEATNRLVEWTNSTSTTAIAPLLMYLLNHSQHDIVIFYALSTFKECTITSIDRRIELRNLLLNWPGESASLFLQAKIGEVLSLLVQWDFPQTWPNALYDLTNMASPTIWLRTWDELFQDLEYSGGTSTTTTTTTTFDPQRSILVVKEAIRGTTLASHVLTTLTTAIKQQPKDSLRKLALQVLRRTLSWLDLNLILRDVVGLLFLCLSHDEGMAVSALECLQEIMNRGMDPTKKLQLFMTTNMLHHIHAHVNLDILDVSPIGTVLEVAKFVNMTGLELVSFWEDDPALHNLLPLLQQVFDLFLRCFAFDDIDVSGAVIPLASRLTLAMGMNDERHNNNNNNNNGNPFRTSLPQLLAIVYRQMRYPPDFTFAPDDEDEAEEEIYRAELRKLNLRLVKVAPDVCLGFLCEALANLPMPISTSTMPDVEAALRMVFHYSEGIRPPPGLKVVMKNVTFRSILVALHNSDITSHPHSEVLMLYYDLAVRYFPIFKDQPELLPSFLGAISGPNGLQHANPRVTSRSCYLLLKLVKSLVSDMRPYVETAVTGIQGLLSNQSQYSLRPDDALYLFETIGLLLGKTGLSPKEQQQSLTKVMAPHIQSIEEMIQSSDLARDPEYFGGVLSSSLSAVAYLSKGFSKPPPEVQLVLAETLNVALVVLEVLPEKEQIRRNSIILFQRMIQCLGLLVLENAPRFFAILIVNCTSGDVVDVAQMFNQLCIKFKQDAAPALDRALLPFLQKCHSLMPVTGEVVQGDIPPHLLTEQLSIKKLTFTVLQHIVTHRATVVLLSPSNSPSFESIMRTMSEGAISVEDAVMKKTCIQFFQELVDQWGEQVNGSINGNSSIQQVFLQYICTSFGPGMIKCLLDPNFDEKDAMLSRCVVEFASVFWSFKARRGAEIFQQGIVMGCLQSSGCPSNILAGFQAASNRIEMEVCMKEMVKVMKVKRSFS